MREALVKIDDGLCVLWVDPKDASLRRLECEGDAHCYLEHQSFETSLWLDENNKIQTRNYPVTVTSHIALSLDTVCDLLFHGEHEQPQETGKASDADKIRQQLLGRAMERPKPSLPEGYRFLKHGEYPDHFLGDMCWAGHWRTTSRWGHTKIEHDDPPFCRPVNQPQPKNIVDTVQLKPVPPPPPPPTTTFESEKNGPKEIYPALPEGFRFMLPGEYPSQYKGDLVYRSPKEGWVLTVLRGDRRLATKDNCYRWCRNLDWSV